MGNITKKKENKPIYDEKVKTTIRALTEGKSLEDIAVSMGYGNTKSLDIYMRRKNFRYNRAKENYEPVEQEKDKNIIELPSSSKVSQAIHLLGKEGADPKTVAKRLGFKDHIDLANFMKMNGYEYNSDIGNYIKKRGIIEPKDNLEDVGDAVVEETAVSLDEIESTISKSNDLQALLQNPDIKEYVSILEMLRKNKDKLVDFLIPEVDNGKIPRFAIGGTFVTKSVHMSNLLDQMVREFSIEKNISQRDIFEVALIGFFRKYGYSMHVETLLSQ